MNEANRRLALLRRMAWLCAACVLVIVTVSAALRLTRAGLGCADWPQCYAQALRAPYGEAASASAATAALRVAHRVFAATALVLVLMMAMTCLATRPPWWREGRIALALLACALFLAVLGVWTKGARVPAVALANLLGGFVMLALCWRMVRVAGAAPPARRGPGAWGWIGVAAVAWLVVSGGLVSASFAGLSCPELGRCDLRASSWLALDPWREPRVDAADVTNPAGALAHLTHRASALVAAPVLLALVLAAWRAGRRRAAAALIVLLAAQAALGVLLVVAQLPLPAALAHNLLAALLLALVLDLALTRPV